MMIEHIALFLVAMIMKTHDDWKYCAMSGGHDLPSHPTLHEPSSGAFSASATALIESASSADAYLSETADSEPCARRPPEKRRV